MSDERDKDDEGFEGDVSDHAGDRLGGGVPKKEVEVAPLDQPAAPVPEP